MRHLPVMLAVVALLAFGISAASASPLPQHSPSDPLWNLDPGPGVFISNSFDTGGSHTDTYDFMVTGSGTLGTVVAAFNQLGGLLSFTSLEIVDITTSTASTLFSGPPTDFISLSFSGLISGHEYHLNIGTTTGAGGGSYIGKLRISEVPLPASMTLLLTGIGMLALVMLRKRFAATA